MRSEHPKILKNLFNLTKDNPKIPTNPELDNDIELLGFHMKVVWPLLKKILKVKIGFFFKYNWKKIVVAFGIFVLLYFSIMAILRPTIKYIYETERIEVASYPDDSTMTLDNFLKQIQYTESRYNASARREGSQYWGHYQLGTDARRIGGYGDLTYEQFSRHPEIQKLCMINFLKANKKDMQKYINKYSNKIIDGILITESSILGMCQLGNGATRMWLDSNIIPRDDGNGNNPREFAKLGGYKLHLDKIK